VLTLATAAIPDEPSDDPLAFNGWAGAPSKMLLMEWLIAKVAPLSADPLHSLAALHDACVARVTTAEPGSTLQLAAFQGAVSSATDPERVRAWLGGGAPAGIELDLNLRWRILVQLAAMGAIDRTELDRHLADEPTATSRVDHARAVASMPTADAKAWAWDRFVGVEDVPNYELQATGQGMWRPGQEHLTDGYAKRFFDDLPATTEHRSGWVLAEAACWFFPLTALDRETVDRATELAGDASLDLPLRRQMAIMADEMRRRLAVRDVSPAAGSELG
jgi:aminopeptidase N